MSRYASSYQRPRDGCSHHRYSNARNILELILPPRHYRNQCFGTTRKSGAVAAQKCRLSLLIVCHMNRNALYFPRIFLPVQPFYPARSEGSLPSVRDEYRPVDVMLEPPGGAVIRWHRLTLLSICSILTGSERVLR